MLEPKELGELGNNLAFIYRHTGTDILEEIAKNAQKVTAGKLTKSEAQRAITGFTLKQVGNLNTKMRKEIDKQFDIAMKKSINNDVRFSGKPINISPSVILVAKTAKNTLQKELRKYNTSIVTLSKITLRTALTTKDPLQQYARIYYTGLKTPDLNGRDVEIDVFAARRLATVINQTVGRQTLMICLDNNIQLVGVTAHEGARNTGSGPENHESWQGKVYELGSHSEIREIIKLLEVK
jgi:hypothetical protein